MSDKQLSDMLANVAKQCYALVYGLGIGALFLGAVGFITFRCTVLYYSF